MPVELLAGEFGGEEVGDAPVGLPAHNKNK